MSVRLPADVYSPDHIGVVLWELGHLIDHRRNAPRTKAVVNVNHRYSIRAGVEHSQQGRDASDVPITQTFGPNTLVSFKVWTDEVEEA